MRFVSKYKGYSIAFQRDITEHYATGQERLIQPLLNCEFDKYGSLSPHEMEAARLRFTNHGLPTEVDEITFVDPAHWYSVFDSDIAAERWELTPEKKNALEQFLLGRFECGNDYIHVPTPVLAPPWPNYDTFRGVRGTPTAQRIAERVQEDGYEIATVVAYERANANRAEVLAALEQLSKEEPGELLIQA